MLKLVVLILGLFLATNALVVPADDKRIYYTEHNWYKDPAGFRENLNSGAYIKVGFNGSSLTLNLDGSFANAQTTLAWSVDDGPEQSQTSAAMTSITLASGLNKAVTHSLYLFVRNHVAGDRWYNQATRLRVTGLTIDDDATLFAPKLAPKRLLAYWDSIGEGAVVNGNVDWTIAHDAHLTFAFSLALGINAELSLVAFGGQGYTRTGSGNSPQLWSSSGLPNESAWNWLSVHQKRTFETCPDYIINGHGTNDAHSDQTVVYTNSLGWLKDVRKVCPQSHVFFTVPFGQFCENTLVQAHQDYQSVNPDPLTSLIQMGEQASPGLKNTGGPSFAACDSLHPWGWKSSQLGALLAAKISPIINQKRSSESFILSSY